MVAEVDVVAPQVVDLRSDDVLASTITWRSPLPSRRVANPRPPRSRLSRTRPITETRVPVQVSGASVPAAAHTSASVWVRGQVTG